MEFIKLREDRYLIKDSNNIVVSEKEKLQLEEKTLVLKDISSNECQKENTKKRSKIKKQIEEIEEKEIAEVVEEAVEEVIEGE